MKPTYTFRVRVEGGPLWSTVISFDNEPSEGELKMLGEQFMSDINGASLWWSEYGDTDND